MKKQSSIRQCLTGLLVNQRHGYTLLRLKEKAIQELRRDNSVVILLVNKGRATVVMDRLEYNQKIQT